jgi:hypothetical protein
MLNSYPASFFVEENKNISYFLDNLVDSKINIKSILPEISEDLIEDFLVFENYIHVSRFSFIHFFINNLIDVPICFKKSKSLKNKNFEIFFLKFSNLVMRDGMREKTIRVLLSSVFSFFAEIYKKDSQEVLKSSK